MRARRLKTVFRGLAARQFQTWSDLRRQQLEKSLPPPDHPPAVTDAAPIPPDHWPLRSSGPPAHWVELVRAKAPGLLDGSARGVLQAQRKPLAAAPPLPLQVTNDEQTAVPPALTVMEPPVADVGPTSGQAGEEAAADQPHPLLTFSVSKTPPVQPPVYRQSGKRGAQPLTVYTSSETGHPAALQAETPAAPKPAQPPTYESPGTAPQMAAPESPRTEALPPSELSVSETVGVYGWEWKTDHSPTVPVVVFPRYGELSPITRQAAPLPQTETPSQATALPPSDERAPAVPRAVYTDAPRAAPPAASRWESLEGDWPELPRLDEPGGADESSLLRAWNRRERLDREQRGVGWSEPLS